MTGRRKTAVAQLIFTKNPQNRGKILIQRPGKTRKPVEPLTYFLNHSLVNLIHKPLKVTRTAGHYDIVAKLQGGGLAGQAGALSFGIAKLLVQVSDDYRLILRSAKLLTRDARIKERKKFGLKKARKASQFSKR